MKYLILQYKRFSLFNKLSKIEHLAAITDMTDEADECIICHEALGQRRVTGPVEETYILPCGHVFGSICITTWLQSSSLNKDCPICRRSMLYRGCGHDILPLAVPAISKAAAQPESSPPQAIPEQEMPDKCPVCRDERFGGELSWMQKRKETEEGAIRALRVLPGIFGGLTCRLTAMDIERRVQENRTMWMVETDGWVERRRREVGWIW